MPPLPINATHSRSSLHVSLGGIRLYFPGIGLDTSYPYLVFDLALGAGYIR
jgi:hypothetical protein